MIRMNDHIVQLILKYARNEQLDTSELSGLQAWQERSEYHQLLPDRFRDKKWLRENLGIFESAPSEEMWDHISSYVQTGNSPGGFIRTIVNKRGLRVAAMFILIAGIGVSIYFRFYRGHSDGIESKMSELVYKPATDKKYLSDRVLLTVDDGQPIVLDGKPDNMVVFADSYTGVNKTDSNRLVYQVKTRPDEAAAMIYHTLTTHRTPPFILVLPDSSKVWLNNASSIRYPTFFAGKNREVELTGEAYFEVAGDRSRPFKVKMGKVVVEALGTGFNIMAYGDEPTGKITLLQGSVNVNNGVTHRIIKPFQQVQVKNDQLEVNQLRDFDEVLAWRNNAFHFDHTELMTAMRQIARWYQYDLENKDSVRGKPIGGNMSRSMPVKDVLEAIHLEEDDQAYFKIENKTIKITATPTR
jgi:transmembrane sensor